MEHPQPGYIVDDLLKLAWTSRVAGNWEYAEATIQRAIQVCLEHDLESRRARCLAYLGQIDHDTGRLPEAIKHYSDALGIYRRQNAHPSIAHVVRHIADLQRETGAYDDANAHYEEALSYYSSSEQAASMDIANTLRGLALLQELKGNQEQAVQRWRGALAIYQSCGISEGVDECARHLEFPGFSSDSV